MGEVEGNTPQWQYRRSVRDHVREPLGGAIDRLDREREELHAERRALQRFADDVAEITPAQSVDGPMMLGEDPAAEKWTAVREAYRETIMAVEHYDAVYDEPMLVNVASELNADIAESLRPETRLPFTEPLQSVVHDAAIEAADRRERFAAQVESERESIERADRTLCEIIDRLGTTGLAASDRHWFHDRVDDLVATRQERLQSRSVTRQDGHDLCGYVYAEESWTYPVLTAIARLRNSVE